MNKIKQNREIRRILNQVKHSSLSGNKEGYFYAYFSEKDKHIDLKYLTWKKLRKQGFSVWCEPIFKIGIRMDLLCFNGNQFFDIEILSSETVEQLSKKIEKYPEIDIIKIQNELDIERLEL